MLRSGRAVSRPAPMLKSGGFAPSGIFNRGIAHFRGTGLSRDAVTRLHDIQRTPIVASSCRRRRFFFAFGAPTRGSSARRANHPRRAIPPERRRRKPRRDTAGISGRDKSLQINPFHLVIEVWRRDPLATVHQVLQRGGQRLRLGACDLVHEPFLWPLPLLGLVSAACFQPRTHGGFMRPPPHSDTFRPDFAFLGMPVSAATRGTCRAGTRRH